MPMPRCYFSCQQTTCSSAQVPRWKPPGQHKCGAVTHANMGLQQITHARSKPKAKSEPNGAWLRALCYLPQLAKTRATDLSNAEKLESSKVLLAASLIQQCKNTKSQPQLPGYIASCSNFCKHTMHTHF